MGLGRSTRRLVGRNSLRILSGLLKRGDGLKGVGMYRYFCWGIRWAELLPSRSQLAQGLPGLIHQQKQSPSSGVIVTSPLITLTQPASSVKRWFGTKMALISPRMTIPAVVKGTALSHDPKVAELYNSDPLIRQVGSLRGMSDMLGGGEQLLDRDYQHWPKKLPLLLIHGTDDQVTSCKATQTFYDKVVADDKKLSLYEGGYHELQNEPDGVQEKLVEECIVWMEARISGANTAGAGAEAATTTSKL